MIKVLVLAALLQFFEYCSEESIMPLSSGLLLNAKSGINEVAIKDGFSHKHFFKTLTKNIFILYPAKYEKGLPLFSKSSHIPPLEILSAQKYFPRSSHLHIACSWAALNCNGTANLRFIADQNSAINPCEVGWRIPLVNDPGLENYSGPWRHFIWPLEHKIDVIKRNIGANLSLSDARGFFDHFSGGFQSEPNKDNADRRNPSHYQGRQEHQERPPGHFHLGYKVVLGALLFICGIYYFGYAFKRIDTLEREAGIAYLVTGMSFIASGVIIALASGFSQF